MSSSITISSLLPPPPLPPMAEHGDKFPLSSTSDDDSSNRSPRSFLPIPSLTIDGASGSSSLSRYNNQTPPPPLNTEFFSPPPPPSTGKKPRGRPPGSKNKPKPPIVINQDSEQALKPVVIEVPSRSDLLESLISFASRRNVGISVLSAWGSIASVTLRHPISHAPSFTLHGPFTIVSLTGTYIPDPCSFHSSPPSSTGNFGICLSGTQGQVFGGVIGGKVSAGSLVVVMATVFKRPEIHRVYVIADEADEGNNTSVNHLSSSASASASGGRHESITHAMPLNAAFNVADANMMQWGHPSSSRSHANF